MGIRISDFYGKRVLSVSGKMLGSVKEVIIDTENSTVSHILLSEIRDLTKSADLRSDFFKNSIEYKRVKKVSDLVVVSDRASP